MTKKHLQQLYITFTGVFLAVFLVMGFWVFTKGLYNLSNVDQAIGGAIIVLVAVLLYAYSKEVGKWR